jgi:hypothetical protein
LIETIPNSKWQGHLFFIGRVSPTPRTQSPG